MLQITQVDETYIRIEEKKRMNARNTIEALVQNITPCDELEKQHIEQTLTWIQSGAPIFRLEKPDNPPKHLCAYVILFDEDAQKILLVDHKKAQLWLPTGGHVDVDEHPQKAAQRECQEELNIEADFWRHDPILLTSTVTVGLTAGHTDISFWYVLKGNHQQEYTFDTNEFNSIRWFGFDEIPHIKSDPHLQRFIGKLRGML